jgi:hypothetical protein
MIFRILYQSHSHSKIRIHILCTLVRVLRIVPIIALGASVLLIEIVKCILLSLFHGVDFACSECVVYLNLEPAQLLTYSIQTVN